MARYLKNNEQIHVSTKHFHVQLLRVKIRKNLFKKRWFINKYYVYINNIFFLNYGKKSESVFLVVMVPVKIFLPDNIIVIHTKGQKFKYLAEVIISNFTLKS